MSQLNYTHSLLPYSLTHLIH
ncbi:hypothetical protein PT2222_130076 [Paraburkholderia tropica]